VPAPNDFPGAAPFVASYTTLYRTAPNVWTPYAYDSVNLLAAAAKAAGGFAAEPLTKALTDITGFKGWTGTVGQLEAKTGNRTPASVTVDRPDSRGAFHVDTSWSSATNFQF